jgi:hypothetical protein
VTIGGGSNENQLYQNYDHLDVETDKAEDEYVGGEVETENDGDELETYEI